VKSGPPPHPTHDSPFPPQLIAENTLDSIVAASRIRWTRMTIRKAGAIAILKIPGMDKAGRAQQFRRAAERLDGILRLDINYIGDTATIEYDIDRLTLAQVESLHRIEPRPALPPEAADPARGSRGDSRTRRRVQGREKGDINRILRRRGRYSRTQRGRLGE